MVCADEWYAADSKTIPHHHVTSSLGTVHYLTRFHVPCESCSKLQFIVSSEQLIIQHGIFHRTSDYIELYRIVDFCEQRCIMEQLFGLKTISIYSGDRTNPKLDIYGVREKLDVVGIIRERVEYNKQRRGVYEITNR